MSDPIIDDDLWDRQPTAYELAHYNAVLKREANRASERARAIFGTCLLQLTQLGMKQAQARSMLGKWRSKAGDDDRSEEHTSELQSLMRISYAVFCLKKKKKKIKKNPRN